MKFLTESSKVFDVRGVNSDCPILVFSSFVHDVRLVPDGPTGPTGPRVPLLPGGPCGP